MSKLLKVISKFMKEPYKGDRIYFVVNKKTDHYGFFTKKDTEKQILDYGVENFIIFHTSDVIEIESELEWLDE